MVVLLEYLSFLSWLGCVAAAEQVVDMRGGWADPEFL